MRSETSFWKWATRDSSSTSAKTSVSSFPALMSSAKVITSASTRLPARPRQRTAGIPTVEICVKRVSYIDDVSGEKYKGVASHYLCDRKPGDQIKISGPYGLAFDSPR